MTSPQARSAGIIANPQNQVVIQSPQAQAQQQIAASKLTSAANSLLQLQQQQQQLILASATPVVNLCNSMPSQNFVNNNNNNGNFKLCNGDNNESVNQQTSSAGPFKVYSELNLSHIKRSAEHSIRLLFQLNSQLSWPLMNIFLPVAFSSTGNPDILICGNCREMFSELSDLLDHKRSYCKLRFTCKCQEQLPTIINSKKNESSRKSLLLDSRNSPFLMFVQRICIHHQNCCVWFARIRSAIHGIWWCMPKQRTWWIFMKSESRTRKTTRIQTAKVIN